MVHMRVPYIVENGSLVTMPRRLTPVSSVTKPSGGATITSAARRRSRGSHRSTCHFHAALGKRE
jgi:hypothetical protein